jgi:tetratricopeptide (TPR) repeat protein
MTNSSDKTVAMKNSWATQIETWNELVKTGRGSLVARELSAIPRGKIPVDLLAKIANLAWRINQPSVGLKLLFHELRKHSGLKVRMHPDAYSEYAACLVEVGALSEAKMILREAHDYSSKSKFYLALLYFKEWDYQSALPLLEEYLTQIPFDYHQLVVRINLVATYVINEEFEKAQTLLKELREQLIRGGHRLLLGNSYEIESQIYFRSGEHEKALACLAQGEAYLVDAKNMGWLYSRKWQVLNKLKLQGRGNITSHLAGEIDEIKIQAKAMGSWETLRELDLQLALHTSDSRLLNHVYFGSPLSLYRRRIEQEMKKTNSPTQIADEYVLSDSLARTLGRTSAQPAVALDALVVSGHQNSQSFLIKKLLMTLSSDFYAPFRTGQLFSHIYEGEFYDVETSPDRIVQLVRRLRNWVEKEKWNCSINSSNIGYKLLIEDSRGLLLSRALKEEKIETKSNVHSLLLRKAFGDKSFSAKEVSEVMACSPRSANRALKELKGHGQVILFGKGRFTRFKLVG